MKTILIPVSLIIISTVFFSCKDSTVSGDPKNNTSVFPNTQGTFWGYQVTDSLNQANDSLRVSVGGKLQLSSGRQVTVWQLSFSDSIDSNYVFIDGDSVKIFEDEENLMQNTKLIFPLKEGKGWRGDYVIDSFYVSDVTDLSVPAGNFSGVYVIERSYGGFNEYRKMTIWFVPDVGIIKLHLRDIGLSFQNEVRELTSYQIQEGPK